MRNAFVRIVVGCGVAGLSGAADGAILALADPEHVMENFRTFLVIVAILGIKGALMYFKQHEKELSDTIDTRTRRFD